MVAPTQDNEPFEVFFQQFGMDSAYQSQRIVFPLTISMIDREDKLSKETIQKKEWGFLNFSEDSLASKNDIDAFKGILEKKGDSSHIYKREGIDNGINVAYYFSRKAGKWYLVTIVDKSS